MKEEKKDGLEAQIAEVRRQAGLIEAMLDGCLQVKRNRVAKQDGGVHVSPKHYQFQYRNAQGVRRYKSVPAAHRKEVLRLIAQGREYRDLERKYAALVTEATFENCSKKNDVSQDFPVRSLKK